MALVNLTFVQRKLILNFYWKTENVTGTEALEKFGMPSPTRVTVTKTVINLRFKEQCKMWTRSDLEDPAVQHMTKVLRQCYRRTHNLQGSLWVSVFQLHFRIHLLCSNVKFNNAIFFYKNYCNLAHYTNSMQCAVHLGHSTPNPWKIKNPIVIYIWVVSIHNVYFFFVQSAYC
jgi:hypothetical protein